MQYNRPLSAHLSNNNPDVSVFAPHVKNGIPEEFRPVLWPLFMGMIERSES